MQCQVRLTLRRLWRRRRADHPDLRPDPGAVVLVDERAAPAGEGAVVGRRPAVRRADDGRLAVTLVSSEFVRSPRTPPPIPTWPSGHWASTLTSAPLPRSAALCVNCTV